MRTSFEMPLKSVFKEVLPTLEKFSPSIAAAIGGPVGFAMSFIIPLLAKSFGTETHDVSSLVKAILKDPESPVKLQSLEHQHHDWICGMLDSINNLQSAEISIKLEWNKKY